MTNVAAMDTGLPCWANALYRVPDDAEPTAALDITEVGNSLIGIEIIGYEERGLAERLGGVQLEGEAVNQLDRRRIALVHNISGPTAVSTITNQEGPWANGS
jgi:hypothetical protein